MKVHSILPRPLELDPHHQMQFSVIPRTTLELKPSYEDQYHNNKAVCSIHILFQRKSYATVLKWKKYVA